MKKHILCLGDSNTHGLCGDPSDCADGGNRYNEEERWPCLLQKALGDEYLVIEEGLNNPNLNQIVAQYKSGVTRKIREILPDMRVWQRSYHDHVIRDQKGYEKIWTYIENNPLKWEEDCFYQNQ